MNIGAWSGYVLVCMYLLGFDTLSCQHCSRRNNVDLTRVYRTYSEI